MSVTESIETMQDNYEEIIEEKKPFVDKDTLERAKKYILPNKEKPIKWHMKSLLELNLVIPYEILEEILITEREKKYPYDNQFLFNMDNIFINLDNSNLNLKKMHFCQRLKKILNPAKDYREEKFYIFSSLYQIKHFIESDKIFIDLNYKVCPKSFMQLMTILAYNNKNDKIMPCFFIPMSHSTFILYDYVFKTILELIDDYELNYDNTNKNILLQAEIESNLVKAFKNNFEKTINFGCYFSYVKKIWKKAKKCGLFKKDAIDFTKNILFGLMIIIFIKKENLINFFNEIKEYTNQISKKLKPYFDVFIKYCEDKILTSNFINFSSIRNNKEWILKTNDIIESYNNKFSNSLEHFFPKMAYLTRKMKDISRYYYNNKLYNNENNTSIDENNNNIFKEIFQFINDYILKDKNIPSFKDLLNIDNEFKKRIEIIFIKYLKLFFGLQCKTFNLNSEDDYNLANNEFNFKEIESIIPSIFIKIQDEDEKQSQFFDKSGDNKVEENKIYVDSSANGEDTNKKEQNNKDNINNNKMDEESKKTVKKGKVIDVYLDYDVEKNNNEFMNEPNKDNFENIIEKLFS